MRNPDNMEEPCVHGHMPPPECPSCLTIERDTLSDAFRTQGDKLLKAQQECEALEQLCLDLVTGIDALSSLLIEHHACSDDGTGSLICNVCASKTGKRLWKESDAMKQKWCDWQNQKYGKPF